MNKNYLNINYFIKFISLFLFWKIIILHPKLNKYSRETMFSVYRSLMCIYFTLYALENFICNFNDIFTNPFTLKESYDNITEWFIVYLLFDIIIMFYIKNKRIDLHIHHIWSLIVYVIGKYYGNCGAIYNMALIIEAISLVSGLDSMAIEDNNNKESYYYKLYRKHIINYVRLPIFVISFIILIMHQDKGHFIPWLSLVVSVFIMGGLDYYWKKKCDKVINKYKNN